ncbi:MAG TPA: acetylglutamate kinase [Elusimicrobiota bacterium]|nr:acetylglutamate kinase [Elusimicrobiota bacterium]
MTRSVWVVKFGGSLLSDDKARKAFLRQVARLARRRPVALVHGGGPEISAALQKMGVKPVFVKGRRVTDDAAMTVVEGVLSGQVNKKLVGELCSLGVRAVGLSGRDGGLLLARPVKGLGRVGEPLRAAPGILRTLLQGKFLPVISSVASDARGRALNVNADEAAAAVAVWLKADRLVYLTDVAGVLDARKKTIPKIHTRDIQGLIDRGVVTGGMIPKVLSCRRAIRKGVREIDIIDGRAGLLKMKGTRLLP